MGTIWTPWRLLFMERIKASYPNFRTAMASLILASMAAWALPSHGQSPALVISPQTAQAVKSNVSYQGETLLADRAFLVNSGTASLETEIKVKRRSFSDSSMPAWEQEMPDNSKMVVGVLSGGAGEANGTSRRNPHSIENINRNPMHPEGIYVNEMRAKAGLGLSSEF